MIKKCIFLSLIVSSILISSGWALTNGNFESGDLSGWSIYYTNSGQATVDYGTAHTGDYCARLYLGSVSSDVSIDQSESEAGEGETWKVEGWCYKTGGTCNFGWYAGSEQNVTAGSWVKYSDTITFGSGQSKEVDFYLTGILGSTAYLDDVVTSRVYQTLNQYGSFDSSGDLIYWFFQKYGDGTGPGTINWISSYNGQNGVIQMSQNAGEKAQLSQVFSVPSSGWYTATAKVATDISDPTKQQKVYLYLQELASDTTVAATGNIIIQPGKGGFGGTGIWRDLKISFYATNTLLGVQVVGIAPLGTGVVGGNLYIDDVFVNAGASQPTGNVTITNANFDSNITGWTLELYADGYSTGTWDWTTTTDGNGICYASQTSGEKGKLSQVANLPYAQHDAIGSLWVYSGAAAMANTQKVYLYIYSYANSSYANIQESGNVILQPGKWAQGVWRELKFGYSPLTNYNYVQFVGINKTGQPPQSIYFDSVSVKQD
jgi:hypothetical protein